MYKTKLQQKEKELKMNKLQYKGKGKELPGANQKIRKIFRCHWNLWQLNNNKKKTRALLQFHHPGLIREKENSYCYV